MRKIRIKLNKTEIEANYTKNIFELMDGLFRDMTKPLLMEFDFILRPITISTNSRKSKKFGTPEKIFNLPVLDILTFNPQFNRVRTIKNVENGVKIPMKFKEKYVLEVPKNINIPFEEIYKIEKLEFSNNHK
jgi:hypothetical protein